MASRRGRTLTWILFIVLILLAIAVVYFFQKTSETPAPGGPGAKPGKGFAVRELTPEEKSVADNAALGDALKGGSLEGCNKIVYDDKLKQKCLDSLNYDAILRSGDEAQCEKISDADLRQACADKIYSLSAMDTLDPAICQKIHDSALKQNCLDKIIASKATSATSANDCQGIKDPALKTVCLDTFYYQNSTTNSTATGCANISDPDLKTRCGQIVTQNQKVIEAAKANTSVKFQTAAETLTGCSQLSGTQATQCKNKANFDLALEKKDLSYCDKIADAVMQKDCQDQQGASLNRMYLRQAITSKDPTLCNKITDASVASTCRDNAK